MWAGNTKKTIKDTFFSHHQTENLYTAQDQISWPLTKVLVSGFRFPILPKPRTPPKSGNQKRIFQPENVDKWIIFGDKLNVYFGRNLMRMRSDENGTNRGGFRKRLSSKSMESRFSANEFNTTSYKFGQISTNLLLNWNEFNTSSYTVGPIKHIFFQIGTNSAHLLIKWKEVNTLSYILKRIQHILF